MTRSGRRAMGPPRMSLCAFLALMVTVDCTNVSLPPGCHLQGHKLVCFYQDDSQVTHIDFTPVPSSVTEITISHAQNMTVVAFPCVALVVKQSSLSLHGAGDTGKCSEINVMIFNSRIDRLPDGASRVIVHDSTIDEFGPVPLLRVTEMYSSTIKEFRLPHMASVDVFLHASNVTIIETLVLGARSKLTSFNTRFIFLDGAEIHIQEGAQALLDSSRADAIRVHPGGSLHIERSLLEIALISPLPSPPINLMQATEQEDLDQEWEALMKDVGSGCGMLGLGVPLLNFVITVLVLQ